SPRAATASTTTASTSKCWRPTARGSSGSRSSSSPSAASPRTRKRRQQRASILGAMSAHALAIRGTPYPVLLPSVRDPRLHLAAVIVSLQVLGQATFSFQLSIAQILIAVGTCAALDVGIAVWRQRVIMWPASALITGNGVGFILRVPGT